MGSYGFGRLSDPPKGDDFASMRWNFHGTGGPWHATRDHERTVCGRKPPSDACPDFGDQGDDIDCNACRRVLHLPRRE